MLASRMNCVKLAASTRGMARGVHLSFAAPQIIEILAQCGLDYVYFDGEHGTYSASDIAEGCRTAELCGLTPIARLPNSEKNTITHFLDRGVRGLVLPHVETAEQAGRIVDAAYFAPIGQRSYGAGRPEFGLSQDVDLIAYREMCNARTSVGVLIESSIGLQNAAAIAQVQGIDYVGIGLFDLCQSLGYPGQPQAPEVTARVDEACAAFRDAGKAVSHEILSFAWINDLVRAGAKATIR